MTTFGRYTSPNVLDLNAVQTFHHDSRQRTPDTTSMPTMGLYVTCAFAFSLLDLVYTRLYCYTVYHGDHLVAILYFFRLLTYLGSQFTLFAGPTIFWCVYSYAFSDFFFLFSLRIGIASSKPCNRHPPAGSRTRAAYSALVAGRVRQSACHKSLCLHPAPCATRCCARPWSIEDARRNHVCLPGNVC